MAKKLSTYLRTYRKRNALTQSDVADLAGLLSGREIVAQHEKRTVNPSLETAFAYEVIFGVPARIIFPGVYQKVEQQVISNAQINRKELSATRETSTVKLKKELMQKILTPENVEPTTLCTDQTQKCSAL